jgi:hypothetical protein
MKTNAELLELCEDGDRAEAIAVKALDKGVPGAKQGRLSGETDICDLLLGRAAREALPRLIAENDEWSKMARADLHTLGPHPPDYALAADMLRASEVTKRADLEDLAYALGHPVSGYTSRGDWEGFRKHWLTAALKEQTP